MCRHPSIPRRDAVFTHAAPMQLRSAHRKSLPCVKSPPGTIAPASFFKGALSCGLFRTFAYGSFRSWTIQSTPSKRSAQKSELSPQSFRTGRGALSRLDLCAFAYGSFRSWTIQSTPSKRSAQKSELSPRSFRTGRGIFLFLEGQMGPWGHQGQMGRR